MLKYKLILFIVYKLIMTIGKSGLNLGNEVEY